MSVYGNPIALLKFQMAPRLMLLMSSGFRKKEPRYACLSEAKASHSQRMWAEVSSCAPHLLHNGLSDSPISWKCLFRLLCPVRMPVTVLDCVLLKNRSLALTPRQSPEINSQACLWVLPRPCHCIVILLTVIPIFYILIPNFTVLLTYVFVNNSVKHKKSW